MRNEGVADTIRKVRVVVDLKGEFARGRRKQLQWDQDADGKKGKGLKQLDDIKNI